VVTVQGAPHNVAPGRVAQRGEDPVGVLVRDIYNHPVVD
jgi:hypothetical protein